jgi:hypothetical protein
LFLTNACLLEQASTKTLEQFCCHKTDPGSLISAIIDFPTRNRDTALDSKHSFDDGAMNTHQGYPHLFPKNCIYLSLDMEYKDQQFKDYLTQQTTLRHVNRKQMPARDRYHTWLNENVHRIQPLQI